MSENYATGSLQRAREAVGDALALIRPAERSPEDYDGTVPFVILRLYLCKYLVEIADDDSDAAYEAYVRVEYWILEGNKRRQARSELAEDLRGLGLAEVLRHALKANADLNGGKGPEFARKAGLYTESTPSGIERALP